MAITLDPKDTSNRIHELVWGGFHADEDIEWIITEEYLDPEELNLEDFAWVTAETARACAEKQAAEESWPEHTEFDRLEAVFTQLRADHIIALHKAGNTLSEGHEDVQEIWQEAGRFDSGIRGCCFYHSQDVEGAVHTGQLYLAFSGGMIREPEQREANTLAVGSRIAELLQAAGFDTEWDGSINDRIKVNLGQWRKRGFSV
ncbi:DUF6891 domain-containing protein [Paenibacillus luteus]|uniref:DUF6891 domain-containing protein n=1 Tax=Paenibacillus luteus TaxID=2545753 RepID=UPI001143B02F|nr:hypothetical protein [Paenibacillus luteus]